MLRLFRPVLHHRFTLQKIYSNMYSSTTEARQAIIESAKLDLLAKPTTATAERASIARSFACKAFTGDIM